MCGIFGYWNSTVESKPIMDKELFKLMGKYAQLRGSDGYGYIVNGIRYKKVTVNEPVEFTEYPENPMRLWSWGLLNCRAKPETEAPTTVRNVQPLMSRAKLCEDTKLHAACVHNGALSNDFVRSIYEKYSYEPITDLDSEAFIPMLLGMAKAQEHSDEREILKEFCESANGGFAMLGTFQDQFGTRSFIAACKYQPLYELSVYIPNFKRTYYYLHSVKEALDECEKYLSQTLLRDSEIVCHIEEVEPYTCRIYRDYGVEEISFKPTYSYPGRVEPKDKVKVLVATSSGIDSTCSLIMAHKLLERKGIDYSIDAIHFKYGHRGQEAEEQAIKKIVEEANKKFNNKFNLKIVNLEHIYKDFFNVKKSQLIDKDSNIETGTNDKLKTTVAWVPVRNMLFQTLMYGLAETYILEEGYRKVYIVAGWNQLSEEGFYPDNSTRFSNAMSLASKFGTLVGHDIVNWNICSRLLKSDEWALAKMLDFLDLYKYTISCDCPVEENGHMYNCDGQCGSTILSQIASKRYIGIKDPREFRHNDKIVVDEKDKFKFYEETPITLSAETQFAILDRLVLIDD